MTLRNTAALPICFFLRLVVCAILAAAPAVSQTPAGYWPFEDGSGSTATDASGNGHPATLANGVKWKHGMIGKGILSSAILSQYGQIPPIDFSATRAITVALWAKRTYSTAGGEMLISSTQNYMASTTGFALLPDDGSCQGIQVAMRGDVGVTANCYNQPSSGVWHHLALVLDKTQSAGSQVSLYIDGALQTPSKNLAASTNTNSFGINPFYLDSQGGNSQFDTGMIDELRVYSTALSAAQIQQLYQTGSCLVASQPSSISFPNTSLGNSSSVLGTLINRCPSSIIVYKLQVNGSSFSLPGLTLPIVIPSGQAAPFTGVFTPATAGNASGSFVFNDNSPTLGVTVPVSGTGVTVQQHSVALDWTASTSQVTGYNAYRGSQSGGPYTLLNSGLIAGTSYTDQNVQSGVTYYYVTTAVNAQGAESVNSNQAVATVP